MYLFAQHLKWKFKDKIHLQIPSKSESRILLVKKFIQFKANLRKKRLGIRKLPALALANKILCQGQIDDKNNLERQADKIIENIKTIY